MTTRNLLTLNAVLVLLVALTNLFSPDFFLNTNGLEVSQSSINLSRAFGAVVIGTGVASWLMRDLPASKARRAFLIGVAVNYLTFSIVNVVNILAIEGESPIVWSFFVMNFLLGLAFAYFASRENV